MVFSSILFLFLYLPLVLLVYYALPKRLRNIFLFFANIVFYGYGEPVFILLMIFSISVNYLLAILIQKYNTNDRKRKFYLILCVILNLSLLGFFKYATFIAETICLLPFFSYFTPPSIPLPIGISFYTFQTLSYVIDVYRRSCPAQKNYITFGCYVALFPQLIAGPIVRYIDVENQLTNRIETPETFQKGVKIFLVGLAKKVLIANQMGLFWTTVQTNTDSVGIVSAWIGIIAFSLQIYFDFSGYSDMARGLGNMLGFEFVKNFDYPYISKSITEFWRRWHISLGTWFREYVYIPLGGNRQGIKRTIINLFITWALTGLWHGASWNFVLWGLYFGIILVIEKMFLGKILRNLPSFISHIYSLLLIVIGWVIFNFTDTAGMINYLLLMFTYSNGLFGDILPTVISYLPLMALAAVSCLPIGKNIYFKLQNKRYIFIAEIIISVIVLTLCVASLVNQSYNPFLYFRF